MRESRSCAIIGTQKLSPFVMGGFGIRRSSAGDQREFRGIDFSESAGSTNLFLKFGGGVRCYVANKRESVPN